MASSFPSSYATYSLPAIQLAHHPSSSSSVTPVVIIKLHRPEARNGWTDTMCDSLVQAFDTLSADPRVKCIVLTSSDQSNKIYCAGLDFNAPPGRYGPTADTHRDTGGQLVLAMYRCNKPIVAAINGSAVGIGITMTLPANIRVVSRDAKIGFVFSRRGFNMDGCCSFFLPRLIGMSRALHLITTGAVYPANHKLLNDLFSEVVAPEEVLPRALELADEIASNVSNLALRVMKDMIFRGPASPEEAHLLESNLFYDLFAGPDAKEGVTSFKQKRKPDFQGNIEKDAPGAYPWWTPKDISVKAKI